MLVFFYFFTMRERHISQSDLKFSHVDCASLFLARERVGFSNRRRYTVPRYTSRLHFSLARSLSLSTRFRANLGQIVRKARDSEKYNEVI